MNRHRASEAGLQRGSQQPLEEPGAVEEEHKTAQHEDGTAQDQEPVPGTSSIGLLVAHQWSHPFHAPVVTGSGSLILCHVGPGEVQMPRVGLPCRFIRPEWVF